jgi:hypothetical protein
VRLSYVEEVSFGVTPSANLTDQRFTSESLGMDTTTVSSEEIRSDRQVADVARASVQDSGDVNTELSYLAQDDWLEAALQSAAWGSPVTVGPAATISVTAGSGDYDVDDSGSGFGSIVVGMWVRISGFANAANNGFGKVTAAAAGSITVSHNGNGVTESAGPSVTVLQGGQIVNGTTQKSYSIEKHFQDLTTTYELLRGCVVDGASLSIIADQVLTAAFTFLGKDAIGDTSSAGTGYVAAPDNQVMNAVDDVLKVLIGGVELCSNQLTLDLVNNSRARNCIGELGPNSIGSGVVGVTGTLQAYFEDNTEMDVYRNFTETDLAITFQDEDGNGYVIELPTILLTAGRSVAGGRDTDVIADFTIEAKRDVSEGITVRIARFAA